MSSSKIMANSLDDSVFDGVAREESVQEILEEIKNVKNTNSGDEIHMVGFSAVQSNTAERTLLDISGTGSLVFFGCLLQTNDMNSSVSYKIELDGEVIMWHSIKTTTITVYNLKHVIAPFSLFSGNQLYLPLIGTTLSASLGAGTQKILDFSNEKIMSTNEASMGNKFINNPLIFEKSLKVTIQTNETTKIQQVIVGYTLDE